MKYKELYLDLTELCKDLANENEQLKSQLSSTDKVIASGQVEYIYHKDDVVALVIGGKLVDEALAFSIIEESGLQGKQVDLILREVK